ncbi:hypothetical protein C5167_022973 [Papaver somniferum]|uniref:Uncharacterized protein n=1 Tax=Papaver somniferum TaxID=3469 RepID=A0A4Y7JN39_PAPSO|nr:hypothetical protein C5167_022973 [Papaver somniferum]
MECLGLRFDGVTVVSFLVAFAQLKYLDLGKKRKLAAIKMMRKRLGKKEARRCSRRHKKRGFVDC